MRYREIITEAPAPASLRQGVLYHGTKETGKARAIMRNGLQPPSDVGRGHLAPVHGRLYLTTDLRYAVIYALGGDYVGRPPPTLNASSADPFGYVFVVRGADLGDVQPDEDSIGEFFYEHAKPVQEPWRRPDGTVAHKPDGTPFLRTTGHEFAGSSDPQIGQIWHHIWHNVTPVQRKKMLNGEYAAWSAGGKRALRTMPDWMKLKLIEMGAHVAHAGPIRPVECWEIDKARAPDLNKDGGNFFQIARKITSLDEFGA